MKPQDLITYPRRKKMKVNGVLILYRDEFKRMAWENMCEAHGLPATVQIIRVVYNEITGETE
jgi:hypothetical protein